MLLRQPDWRGSQEISIDRDARTLQLQGADGTVSTVKVPDGVYELGKLSPGDRIQVNFYVPDAMNPGLRAAGIWPGNQGTGKECWHGHLEPAEREAGELRPRRTRRARQTQT